MQAKTIEDFYKKYGVATIREQSYQDEFRELIEAVFAADERILLILFRGYTPGFNDGDPCYHSGSFGILTTDGLYDSEDVIWEECENEGYVDSEEDAVLLDEFMGVKLDKPISSHIIYRDVKVDKKISATIEGQNLVEAIYDTNYLVKVYRSGNTIKIEHEEYYCGY